MSGLIISHLTMKLVHLGCSKTQTSQSIRLSDENTCSVSGHLPVEGLVAAQQTKFAFLKSKTETSSFVSSPTSSQNAGNTLNGICQNLSPLIESHATMKTLITQNAPPCQLSPFAKNYDPLLLVTSKLGGGCTQEANKALNLRARPKKIFVKYMIL